MKILLEVQLALFQRMENKLFLMKIQILILFPLFLLKRFLMMIYQKLKDFLEILQPSKVAIAKNNNNELKSKNSCY